jgi:methylenetetrahydrofolate reductase (NADPH)
MEATQRPPASRLEQALRSRQFVITAEITPPVSCSAQDLLEKALPLRGLIDAVNVTDGASARAHMSAPIAAAILAREGLEPILQLTCRDRNRLALEGELMGAAACGVRNLLCLTGDDPKAGDQPETKAVFDIDSVTLTRIARDLRDKGELPSGRAVAGAAHFFIGAADVPIDPPPGWRPDKLAAKVAAGAQFAQTQFCMDREIVRRYAARLKEHETMRDFSLLVGLAPLRSAKSARWMKKHLYGTIIPDFVVQRLEQSADPAAEGERIAIELIEELAAIREIAGVHVMAPANDAALPRVIAEARRRLAQRES